MTFKVCEKHHSPIVHQEISCPWCDERERIDSGICILRERIQKLILDTKSPAAGAGEEAGPRRGEK